MIINNVKLVFDDEVVYGLLEVYDGCIFVFVESQSWLLQVLDGEGGWLLLGFIELYIDNFDKFFILWLKVDWLVYLVMSSYDVMMVVSGIIIVLDVVVIGDVCDGGDCFENLEKMVNVVEEM